MYKESKKTIKGFRIQKSCKINIKSGTGNETLFYENRFRFTEKTNLKCFKENFMHTIFK